MSPLGDSSVLIQFGDRMDELSHRLVMEAVRWLDAGRFPGYIECVPAFASVAVHYSPIQVLRSLDGEERMRETVYETVCYRVEKLLVHIDAVTESDSEMKNVRTVAIPVCYGGEYGPDLEEVAAICGRSAAEVVRLHSDADYLVYMIGFAPGFPYLGGMPEEIAAPRRGTPRAVIPAGSVGIAGGQTGVYPLATPGGWQLIGRTPIKLFRPDADAPSFLQAGDRVRFFPITEEEFLSWKDNESVDGLR
ncbi:5-oxoprolinase subunit PxpB [Paenibacillus soyae]|nr:5-oxoprolinase subunit PxpB [Paenibacillus soyae]